MEEFKIHVLFCRTKKREFKTSQFIDVLMMKTKCPATFFCLGLNLPRISLTQWSGLFGLGFSCRVYMWSLMPRQVWLFTTIIYLDFRGLFGYVTIGLRCLLVLGRRNFPSPKEKAILFVPLPIEYKFE